MRAGQACQAGSSEQDLGAGAGRVFKGIVVVHVLKYLA